MFGMTVYLLCGFASLACALVLYRSYKSNRNAFAFWTALAFSFFTINNFLVVVDFITARAIDLTVVRTIPLLVGVGVLICGLIWEAV